MSNLKENHLLKIKPLLAFLSSIIGESEQQAIGSVLSRSEIFSLAVGDYIPADRFKGKGNTIVILLNGLVSGFLVEQSNKRRDIWLGQARSTFIINKPGQNADSFNLEAIEDSYVVFLLQEELETACLVYPVLDRLFAQIIFPEAIKSLELHTRLNKIDKPSQKLSYFKKVYPITWYRVPERIYHSFVGLKDEE